MLASGERRTGTVQTTLPTLQSLRPLAAIVIGQTDLELVLAGLGLNRQRDREIGGGLVQRRRFLRRGETQGPGRLAVGRLDRIRHRGGGVDFEPRRQRQRHLQANLAVFRPNGDRLESLLCGPWVGGSFARGGRRLGRLESCQGQGGDAVFRGQVDDADQMVVRVGDEELIARGGQAGRLVELGRIVGAAGQARAGDRFRGAGGRIDRFDLVVVGVGHVERALVEGHAQRMLQAGTSPRAVDVAEGEQSACRQLRRADDCAHLLAGIEGNGADRASFAVGHVEPRAVGGQAAGLSEGAIALFEGLAWEETPVDNVFPAVARIGADLRLVQTQFPDLVRTGHGDIEIVALDPEIPGAAQGRVAGIGHACHRAFAALLAGASDGDDLLLGQVDFADHVVEVVGHIEGAALEGHALGIVELGLGIVAIGISRDARADRGQERAIEPGDHDPVVAAIGNEQPVARLVGQDLAGKPQRGRLDAIGRQFEPHRRFVQQAVLAIVGQGSFEDRIDLVGGDLATGPPDRVALRIDQDQRRPGVDAKAFPEDMAGVIDHRVLDPVADDRFGDVLGILFRLELGRVDANHHQVLGVGLFELFQLGEDVHAVDAAVRPEVQEHELPVQVLQFDRPVGVEPSQIPWKLRDTQPLTEWQPRHILLFSLGDTRRLLAKSPNQADGEQKSKADKGRCSP